jgi:hypothetical protein
MEVKSRRHIFAAMAAVKDAAGKYAQPGMLGESPCDGCPHVQRCAEGLACRAMALFVTTGRVSQSMVPRQPSREIFRELYR